MSNDVDRLDRYREIVVRVLRDYASYGSSSDTVETEVIVDREFDHYEMMRVGWDGERRVHRCVFHIDIRNGKIWIQYDGTDRPFADELLAAGVPKQDIVLGFHPEYVRHHTEFAVR